MKTPVYLDYNATTPVDPEVLQSMLPYFSEKFGNAASRSHAYGWVAGEAVEIAREQLAHLIGSDTSEIVFTSGATEAINLAIKGVFEAYREKGNRILALATEHKAVLDTCQFLEKQGAHITLLQVGRDGLLDPAELKRHLAKGVILVCIMLANNETGVIQQVQELSRLVHDHGSLLFCDATQACGKIRVDVQEDEIDLLSISAHKMYGPKGCGALYFRRKNPRVQLFAQIHGGGHERGLRSGTLNVPGIVGFGKACEMAVSKMWDEATTISRLRTKLEQELMKAGNVSINGSIRSRLPNTSNLTFSGIHANTLIPLLKNLAVSTGSACSSALPEASHVLKAMGFSDEQAYSSIRFSLGRFTTEEEIDYARDQILDALIQCRGN